MNQELLDWIKQTAERGGAFLEREAPLYAQEVVGWYFWSNTIQAAALIPAALVLGFLSWKLCRLSIQYSPDPSSGGVEVPLGMGGALAGVLCAISAGFAVASIVNATKATVAPRVVIVEHIRGFAK